MGSYNCIGFHSRLPIGSGDEVALLIGLHASPQLKELFLGFLQFYQALRYYGWMLTLPIYGGQDDRLPAMAPLYRRMVEWVDERTK